jgi:hypothetical protein
LLASRPGNGGERAPQLRREAGEWLAQRGRPSDDHQRRAGGAGIARGAVGFAQATPRAIPLHGIPQLSAHREPGARWFGRFAPEHDEGRAIDALTSLEERLEIGAGGQPLASGKAIP